LLDAREQAEMLLTKEKEPWVLREIAEALSEIGDMNSISYLERFLQGESARTRWVVQRAIRDICQRHEMPLVPSSQAA
jgi:HEAT repeat protein